MIQDLALKFVQGLAPLATGRYLRSAIAKEGISAVVCRLYIALPDTRTDLDDVLEELREELEKAVDMDSATMPVGNSSPSKTGD